MQGMRILAGVALIAICATTAQAQTKVRLGLSLVPENATSYVAKEQGIFARHGLDVEIVPTPINSNMPPALFARAIDIGSLSTSILLQAVDGGLELQAITTVSPTSNSGARLGILARTDLTAGAAREIEGKKLGVPAVGGLIDILARRWVIENGGDIKKVAVIEAPFPQMPDMLKAGNIDFAATIDPFYARIAEGGLGKPIANLMASIPDGMPTSAYASTREYARANPAVLKAFRAAIDEAAKVIAADPDAARTSVGVHIKLPPEVLKAAPMPKPAPPLTLAMLQWWADVMVKQNMLKKATIAADILAP